MHGCWGWSHRQSHAHMSESPASVRLRLHTHTQWIRDGGAVGRIWQHRQLQDYTHLLGAESLSPRPCGPPNILSHKNVQSCSCLRTFCRGPLAAMMRAFHSSSGRGAPAGPLHAPGCRAYLLHTPIHRQKLLRPSSIIIEPSSASPTRSRSQRVVAVLGPAAWGRRRCSSRGFRWRGRGAPAGQRCVRISAG